ncbi:Mor transcription activator family protein [Thiocystis violascens]|uniref:Mor transcription activator-like protein n=1 Tax=Thiocystis violascens (strain ATCC 17096 / DSM 198 / 6111) TaxID=765911 RepID=I3YGT9_THIV6|nr:Mor transcription activator family protein [Thiocystis violascens]AFL76207.1 Mor transcription activator-like protein [Thiocystis violascens DSM 198]
MTTPADLSAAAQRPHALRVDLADLPRDLREIADLIGLPGALDLVDTWGGVRLYLPLAHHLPDHHALVARLGRDAAERLCERFGGADLAIPRALAALRAARDRLICHEHAHGSPARALALRYRLSERRVWEILAGADARDAAAFAARQMPLF